jgi:hypothetical protein
MEQILYIIWFVGLIGSIILIMIAVMWSAENRNDAHFKVMCSHSLDESLRHRNEWDKWARITMRLIYSAMALSIISLIAIISAILV